MMRTPFRSEMDRSLASVAQNLNFFLTPGSHVVCYHRDSDAGYYDSLDPMIVQVQDELLEPAAIREGYKDRNRLHMTEYATATKISVVEQGSETNLRIVELPGRIYFGNIVPEPDKMDFSARKAVNYISKERACAGVLCQTRSDSLFHLFPEDMVIFADNIAEKRDPSAPVSPLEGKIIWANGAAIPNGRPTILNELKLVLAA